MQSPSAPGLLEIVDEVVDSVGGGSQLTENLAIVWIVLVLERASGFVDVPEALGDLPAFGLGHPEHPVDGRRLESVKRSPSSVTIPMPCRAGMSHR